MKAGSLIVSDYGPMNAEKVNHELERFSQLPSHYGLSPDRVWIYCRNHQVVRGAVVGICVFVRRFWQGLMNELSD